MEKTPPGETSESPAQYPFGFAADGQPAEAGGSRGVFISFEGGEGVGKTTQVSLLEERIRTLGRDVIAVKEPGTTALGDYLGKWLKTRPDTGAWAELLLFEAARAELVRQVVRPALDAGAIVITDRFADSSTAYQGYGRRLGVGNVKRLNQLATGNLVPDVTVLLDMDVGQALARVENQADLSMVLNPIPTRIDPEGERRFERESAAFHSRVAAGYKTLAAAEPERWLVVDASLPREQIAGAVWARVSPLLGQEA